MKTSSLVNISPSQLFSSKHLSPCRKKRRWKKRLSLRPKNLLKKPSSPSPSKLRASRLPKIMKAISIGDVADAVPEVAVVVARRQPPLVVVVPAEEGPSPTSSSTNPSRHRGRPTCP